MSIPPTPAWRVKPRCPKHLIAVLERAVNALPPTWLLQLTTGEVFDSIEHCRRRLQGYALAEGFEVVSAKSGLVDSALPSLATRSFRPYPRLHQLAVACSGSPTASLRHHS